MLNTKKEAIKTKGISVNASISQTIILSTTKNVCNCPSSSLKSMYGVMFALPLATAAMLVQPYKKCKCVLKRTVMLNCVMNTANNSHCEYYILTDEKKINFAGLTLLRGSGRRCGRTNRALSTSPVHKEKICIIILDYNKYFCKAVKIARQNHTMRIYVHGV